MCKNKTSLSWKLHIVKFPDDSGEHDFKVEANKIRLRRKNVEEIKPQAENSLSILDWNKKI